MLAIILTLIVIAAVYYLITANSDFFEKRGVKFVKGLPFLGSTSPMMLKKKTLVQLYSEFYNQFPDRKFIGFFEMMKPTYMIRDIELIKQITVKDFDHFLNHRLTIDENIDKLFGRILFTMRDQKWKDMRATLRHCNDILAISSTTVKIVINIYVLQYEIIQYLFIQSSSPAFTGSKMRLMFQLLMEVTDDNMKYLKEKVNNSVMDVELFDLLSRYANDVIAKCAFAVSVNSFKDKNNEFYELGMNFLKFSRTTEMKFFFFAAAPKLMQFLKIPFLDQKIGAFFKNLIFKSMEYREKNNIVIHDMINILIQVRKEGQIKIEDNVKDKNAGFATVEESEVLRKTANKITNFDDDDLIAQTLVFFLAGFDSVATSMCFMAYLLALNPDCQEKLISEIDDLHKDLDGKLPTYETIQNMEYLDMVVSESLRLYTPAIFTDRKCSKRFVMQDSDGNPVVLNPGDGVIIPVDAIHKDEKYFPNPLKFDPERFSKENRDKIQSFTYNPFGTGPRNCIGSRFALMECKAVIFSLLSNFRIEKNHLTVDPIVLNPETISLRIKEGFNVRFRLRN